MIYFDNAATSFPKPPCVPNAMHHCITTYCGNPGRSGHQMSLMTAEKIYETRKSVARLLHAQDPLQVVFTGNTTDALNLAIKGVLNPGDHVITTAMEHNSVLRPLHALSQITFDIIPCDADGSIHISDIQEKIKPNTKLMICTCSSNITGTLMPIEEIGKICKNNGILFLVDAAQGAGSVKIDVLKQHIDIVASAGHKGLLGPQGTGFLYVKSGTLLRPLIQGGTGTDSKNLNQPISFPEGYESGTLNSPGIIGLNQGIKTVLDYGTDMILAHERLLTETLYNQLRSMNNVTLYGPEDPLKKTSIVLFNINGLECEQVCDILGKQYQIAGRAGFHCAPLAHDTIGTGSCGAIRLSFGVFNTLKEVRSAVDAIYQIIKM